MSSFYEGVLKARPEFDSTDRVSSLDLLEPTVRQKVLAIVADAKGKGLDLMVYETYRSQQRQEALFKKGATELRTVGVHHFGLACDIVKRVKGEPSWDGSFALLGQLANVHGLIWGGDWGRPNIRHNFVDQPHVQWCSVKDQTRLMSGAWYPEAGYNPYDHL